MYKIKIHGMDTLVLDKNKNGVARFYGSDGFVNAELFKTCKEKADEIFIKAGKPVPKEY